VTCSCLYEDGNHSLSMFVQNHSVAFLPARYVVLWFVFSWWRKLLGEEAITALHVRSSISH